MPERRLPKFMESRDLTPKFPRQLILDIHPRDLLEAYGVEIDKMLSELVDKNQREFALRAYFHAPPKSEYISRLLEERGWSEEDFASTWEASIKPELVSLLLTLVERMEDNIAEKNISWKDKYNAGWVKRAATTAGHVIPSVVAVGAASVGARILAGGIGFLSGAAAGVAGKFARDLSKHKATEKVDAANAEYDQKLEARKAEYKKEQSTREALAQELSQLSSSSIMGLVSEKIREVTNPVVLGRASTESDADANAKLLAEAVLRSKREREVGEDTVATEEMIHALSIKHGNAREELAKRLENNPRALKLLGMYSSVRSGEIAQKAGLKGKAESALGYVVAGVAGAGIAGAIAQESLVGTGMAGLAGAYLGARFGHYRSLEEQKKLLVSQVEDQVRIAEAKLEKLDHAREYTAVLEELSLQDTDLRMSMQLGIFDKNPVLMYRVKNLLYQIDSREIAHEAKERSYENLLQFLEQKNKDVALEKAGFLENLQRKSGKKMLGWGLAGALAFAGGSFLLGKMGRDAAHRLFGEEDVQAPVIRKDHTDYVASLPKEATEGVLSDEEVVEVPEAVTPAGMPEAVTPIGMPEGATPVGMPEGATPVEMSETATPAPMPEPVTPVAAPVQETVTHEPATPESGKPWYDVRFEDSTVEHAPDTYSAMVEASPLVASLKEQFPNLTNAELQEYVGLGKIYRGEGVEHPIIRQLKFLDNHVQGKDKETFDRLIGFSDEKHIPKQTAMYRFAHRLAHAKDYVGPGTHKYPLWSKDVAHGYVLGAKDGAFHFEHLQADGKQTLERVAKFVHSSLKMDVSEKELERVLDENPELAEALYKEMAGDVPSVVNRDLLRFALEADMVSSEDMATEDAFSSEIVAQDAAEAKHRATLEALRERVPQDKTDLSLLKERVPRDRTDLAALKERVPSDEKVKIPFVDDELNPPSERDTRPVPKVEFLDESPDPEAAKKLEYVDKDMEGLPKTRELPNTDSSAAEAVEATAQKDSLDLLSEAEKMAKEGGKIEAFTEEQKAQYFRVKDALAWQYELFGKKGTHLTTIVEKLGLKSTDTEVAAKIARLMKNHQTAVEDFVKGTSDQKSLRSLEAKVRATMFGAKDDIPTQAQMKQGMVFDKKTFEQRQLFHLKEFFKVDIERQERAARIDSWKKMFGPK